MINRRMIALSAAAALQCVKWSDQVYIPYTPPKLEPAPLLTRFKDQRPTTRDRTIEFNGRRLYRG